LFLIGDVKLAVRLVPKLESDGLLLARLSIAARLSAASRLVARSDLPSPVADRGEELSVARYGTIGIVTPG